MHEDIHPKPSRGELGVNEKVSNVRLEFKPNPQQDMLVACLWSHWTAPGEPDLLSFAAITDDPPPEVSAAGHDHCIIPINAENIEACGGGKSPDVRQTMPGVDANIDRAAILKKARAGEVVVLDVRPEEEFIVAHLPHARSLPLDELKKRLAELPKGVPVVAYCRGPFCLMAKDAVALLRKKGYRAFHLTDGVAEWRAHGLPVEQTT